MTAQAAGVAAPRRVADPARATAVIVHWGPVEPTTQLAARLDQMGRVEGIVVVASDGAARPEDLPTTAEWLVPRANLGFAGGFRLGAAARPDSDVYLLLNNDVWLPERTLDACLDLLARDGVGIVGPTLLNAAGIHPGPGRLMPLFTTPRRLGKAQPGEAADVAFVSAAILLIRAECHRQVPMDTRYFRAYEEADLAWRARAAGWRVMVSPYQAWHTGTGVVLGNTSAYFTIRNRIWFARVHGSRRTVAVALWLALGAVPRSVGSDLLRGRGVTRCRFTWHGLLDGIGPLPPVDRPFPDEPRPAHWERTDRPRPGEGRGITETELPSPPLTHAVDPAGSATSAELASSPHRPRAVPATRTTPSTECGEPPYLTLAAELVSELRRIAAVAGPVAAARFATAVAAHAPAVVRTRRFDAADRAMAGRDWTFRPQPGVRIRLPGSAFGDARELYCRRVYAARPGYAPARGESVVDLGADQGLFSLLAASAGADRVLAVQTRRGFAPMLASHAAANGVAGRIELIHALVGARPAQLTTASAGHAAGDWNADVPGLRLADLLDQHGLRHVDLMKIDIEGLEFALFDEPGWLDRVGRMVMEVHPQHGDPAALQRALAEHGFAAVLLDNGLEPTPTLVHASSGYLYARRRFAGARLRRAHAEPAANPLPEPTCPGGAA